MLRCDLNCDMGEGVGNDEALMPLITSANIACGYHAGDEQTMKETLLLAKKYGVAAGAHPSFADRENFGRTEPEKVSPQQVYELVKEQIVRLEQLAAASGIKLAHVKPHGALYNMAARDAVLARAIAQAVKAVNVNYILYGLSGSFLISEAQAAGLRTASEVFADRTYRENGSLTPRSQANALIEEEEQAIRQVVQMVKEGTVTATTGIKVKLVADTVCLHGDGSKAVPFAQAIRKRMEKEGILIQSLKAEQRTRRTSE